MSYTTNPWNATYNPYGYTGSPYPNYPMAQRFPLSLPSAPTGGTLGNELSADQQALLQETLGKPGMVDQFNKLLLDPDIQKALNRPGVMGQFNKLLKDPTVQAEMSRLENMVQTGQITPDQLMDMFAFNDPANRAAKPGGCGSILFTLLAGGGLGIMTARGITGLVNNLYNQQNGWMESTLKHVEDIPGIRKLNENWAAYLAKLGQNPPDLSRVNMGLSWDGRYSIDDMNRLLISPYVNAKNGHFAQDLSKLEQTLRKEMPHLNAGKIMAQIRNAGSSRALGQIVEANPYNFLPAAVGNNVRSQLSEGFPWRYLKAVTGQRSGLTLAHVEDMLGEHHFKDFITRAGNNQRMNYGLAQKVLNRLEMDPTLLGKESQFQQILHKAKRFLSGAHPMSAQDKFATNLRHALADPETGKTLEQFLQKQLSISGTPTPEKLYQALKRHNGKQPIWEVINRHSRYLLYDGTKPVQLSVKPTTLVEDVSSAFKHLHISNQLGSTKAGKHLRSLLSNVAKRARFLENNYLPVARAEMSMLNRLRKLGVGFVGCSLSRIPFYLQRLFDGSTLGRGMFHGVSGNLTGRAFIGLILLGFPIWTALTAPKEARKAQFFDGLGESVGGFLGWEIGRNILPQLGLLRKNPFIARFCAKSFLGLPFTIGGLLSEFILPAFLFGSIGAALVKKPLHLFFGNPKKIEQQLAFEQDKMRDLPTNHGRLDALGQFKQQANATNNGLGPLASNAALGANALTPANIGLTPTQILLNPRLDRIAQKYAFTVDETLRHANPWSTDYMAH